MNFTSFFRPIRTVLLVAVVICVIAFCTGSSYLYAVLYIVCCAIGFGFWLLANAWGDETVEAPSEYFIPKKRKEYEAAEQMLSAEAEGSHPCTHWSYKECMCKGACTCHWRQNDKT